MVGYIWGNVYWATPSLGGSPTPHPHGPEHSDNWIALCNARRHRRLATFLGESRFRDPLRKVFAANSLLRGVSDPPSRPRALQ